MHELVLTALLSGAAFAQGPGRLHPWDARAFQIIRPPEGGIVWKKVPWHTDLLEAEKEARAEKRPLLIWVADDHPLERC